MSKGEQVSGAGNDHVGPGQAAGKNPVAIAVDLEERTAERGRSWPPSQGGQACPAKVLPATVGELAKNRARDGPHPLARYRKDPPRQPPGDPRTAAGQKPDKRSQDAKPEWKLPRPTDTGEQETGPGVEVPGHLLGDHAAEGTAAHEAGAARVEGGSHALGVRRKRIPWLYGNPGGGNEVGKNVLLRMEEPLVGPHTGDQNERQLPRQCR